MKQKYTRLKFKLLLLTALITAAAAVLLWLFFACGALGALEDLFSRCFQWLFRRLFGYSEEGAKTLYARCAAAYGPLFAALGIFLLMLVVFFLVLGRLTRLLSQLGAAVRQVTDETGEPVTLPRELAPLQADLTSLQAALRARRAEAREAEQRKNDLLVFLAHDLKTPLTSVIGYLNLLRDDPTLTAEQRAKYTGIALDKALRLEDLILEFFDITRENLHQAPSEPVDIQLSILLEQLADEFMPQFQQKQLHCLTDIEPRLVVRGDPDKLARVFDNVLRNAVSYSVAGGTVEIHAVLQEGRAAITIRNEGLEIPEQELARIFQKFYRLDAARSSRTGGAGLGLAIAKEIVEAHGGSIRAESNGRKTAFIIELPTKG